MSHSERLKAIETPFVYGEQQRQATAAEVLVFEALAARLRAGNERRFEAATSSTCLRKINSFTNLHYVEYCLSV